MHSDTPLDHALFQLSPRRSRCELFVHGDGKREMIASGLLKPFLSHLRVAEEQAAQAVQSIKLHVDRKNNVAAWFTKGTLDRFVRFVSTPDVLEMVNTLDAEMSQLEGARRIYAQGAGDEQVNVLGEKGTIAPAAADVTKKELLRAIDLRLVAVKQDLAMATARASAAGFTLDSVSALLLFADRFGAHRLNEVCTKFISLCQRRPELISHQNHLPQSHPLHQWKGFSDEGIRSSSGSDMSIDEEIEQPSLAKPLHAGAPVKVANNNSQPSQSQRAASEPPPTCQEGKPFPLHFVGKESQKDDTLNTVSSDPLAEPAGEGPPRRLSLKDRINFFESKQKEQSKGSSTVSSGPVSGNRGLGGKVELRRLQSDVSAEKLVLRRWSGASDMSIDLSSSDSRKDSASAAETPTSSSISISQSGKKIDDKEEGGIQKSATSLSDNSTTQSSMSSSHTEGIQNNRYQNVDNTYEECSSNPIMPPRSVMGERGNMQNLLCAKLVVSEKKGDLAHHNESHIQSNAFMGSSEAAELTDQQPSDWEEDVEVKGQIASQVSAITVATSGEQTGQYNKKGLASQTSRSLSTEGESVNVKYQSTSVSKFRTSVRKVEEVRAKPQRPSDSAFQSKHTSRNSDGRLRKDDSVFPQNQGRTFPESTGVEKKDFDSSLVKEDGLTAPIGVRSHEWTSESASNDTTAIQRKRIDPIYASGGTLSALAGRKVKEGMEVSHLPSTPSLEQAEMVRPSKGNQQLKHELQMKADELEKIFAAHKLRVHGDQMAPPRRGKTAESQVDDLARAAEKRPSESLPDFSALTGESLSNGIELNSTFLLKMVDNPAYVHSINKLGNASDDHRGKFYQTYMQKRSAKLREELSSKGAQKEAKMKAMQDILERSHAEMKAKFSGSPDQQSLTNSRRRIEKLRSYNANATKSQKKIETFVQDEEGMEEPAEVQFGEDKSSGDTQFSDGSSRSSNSKTLSSNKNAFSSAPRTSAAAMLGSSAKTTLSGSARRRTRPENPLAQSVPNLSDLRKENTKPLAGVSKVTTRGQAWNFAGSKNTGEETNIIKKDKERWSESMKKSTAGLGELKDLSPLNSDNPNTVPSMQFDEVQKNGETIASSRNGNGLVSGLLGRTARSKVPRSFEIPKDEEELKGLVDQPEKIFDMDKHNNVLEGACFEGNQVVEFPIESGIQKPRMSTESGMSEEFQTDNGDVLGSPFIVAHHVPVVSSKFNPSTDNVQESPAPSIVYWNSHANTSFSYPLDTSDVDVSVDSPASPSSWNSHPLNEIMDAEAARIRKKWGAAHIPIFVSNNASHQPRKDVSKGFKRLLKFGRKSRGSESLVTDCVSASTASEGDDDAEDGQDVVARPSDELRKSRMGYQFSASDAFDESEPFQDQAQSPPCSIPTPPLSFKLTDEHLSGSSLKAPRSSFFSLSNFRSKGSESKLR